MAKVDVHYFHLLFVTSNNSPVLQYWPIHLVSMVVSKRRKISVVVLVFPEVPAFPAVPAFDRSGFRILPVILVSLVISGQNSLIYLA